MLNQHNNKISCFAPPEPPPAVLAGFEHVNRYWDKRHNIYAAKILPGEFYVTKGEEAVVTVLGSCVSACIRNKRTGVGGMNHFMLPVQTNHSDNWGDSGVSASTRYGNWAMEHLINEILKLGTKKSDLEVKVVGGGKVLDTLTDIGEKNIQFVLDYLASESIPVAGKCMGDIYPRKVVYIPSTGKVMVKKLKRRHNDTLANREKDYVKSISKEQVSGGVDLF